MQINVNNVNVNVNAAKTGGYGGYGSSSSDEYKYNSSGSEINGSYVAGGYAQLQFQQGLAAAATAAFAYSSKSSTEPEYIPVVARNQIRGPAKYKK